MTAQLQIILKQYNEHNMSIEDIVAESEGEYEVESVKAVLAQYSAKYRAAIRGDKNSNEDFSQDEGEMAKQTIASIMMSTDDDYLKFRTAKYIRDDKKGRLDVDKMNGLKIDVMTFNFHIKQVKEARERTMKMVKTDDAVNKQRFNPHSPSPSEVQLVGHSAASKESPVIEIESKI